MIWKRSRFAKVRNSVVLENLPRRSHQFDHPQTRRGTGQPGFRILCDFQHPEIRPRQLGSHGWRPVLFPRRSALPLSDGFLNNSAGRNNDSESWNGGLRLHWDGGEGTRATLGLSFATHELGAQPLVMRNQTDFYARNVNTLDEKTDIDQNQQFLKVQHSTELGELISITNRNDWEMNPNLLDIDFNFEPSLQQSNRNKFLFPGTQVGITKG